MRFFVIYQLTRRMTYCYYNIIHIGVIVKKYLCKQIIIETKDELLFTNSQ